MEPLTLGSMVVVEGQELQIMRMIVTKEFFGMKVVFECMDPITVLQECEKEKELRAAVVMQQDLLKDSQKLHKALLSEMGDPHAEAGVEEEES